jgi:hypothetical protein
MSASFYTPCQKCGTNIPIQVTVEEIWDFDNDQVLTGARFDKTDVWAHSLTHGEEK